MKLRLTSKTKNYERTCYLAHGPGNCKLQRDQEWNGSGDDDDDDKDDDDDDDDAKIDEERNDMTKQSR